jgi:hypothetical protein
LLRLSHRRCLHAPLIATNVIFTCMYTTLAEDLFCVSLSIKRVIHQHALTADSSFSGCLSWSYDPFIIPCQPRSSLTQVGLVISLLWSSFRPSTADTTRLHHHPSIAQHIGHRRALTLRTLRLHCCSPAVITVLTFMSHFSACHHWPPLGSPSADPLLTNCHLRPLSSTVYDIPPSGRTVITISPLIRPGSINFEA